MDHCFSSFHFFVERLCDACPSDLFTPEAAAFQASAAALDQFPLDDPDLTARTLRMITVRPHTRVV
jgi:hypothetical protein